MKLPSTGALQSHLHLLCFSSAEYTLLETYILPGAGGHYPTPTPTPSTCNPPTSIAGLHGRALLLGAKGGWNHFLDFLTHWQDVKGITYTCSIVIVQLLSCIQTLCDPIDCSMTGFPVLHYLPEFAQSHVHWAGDAIQPSHPLSPASPPPSIFPSIKSFPLSQLFASSGQNIGASASVLPMNIQGWFPLGLTGSLRQRDSPRLLPRPREKRKSPGGQRRALTWLTGRQGLESLTRELVSHLDPSFVSLLVPSEGPAWKRQIVKLCLGWSWRITAGHSPNSHRVVPAPIDLSHHPTSPQHTRLPPTGWESASHKIPQVIDVHITGSKDTLEVKEVHFQS